MLRIFHRTFSISAAILATSLLASCSESPSIEGKYGGNDGSTAEFLKDGTAIFITGNRQAVWKWTAYDGNRLKLEPGQGIPGNPSAAVCAYRLEGSTLHVTNCDYSMQLTRL